jgi:hypothetical protein
MCVKEVAGIQDTLGGCENVGYGTAYLVQRIKDQIARSTSVLPKEAMDEYRAALAFFEGFLATAR